MGIDGNALSDDIKANFEARMEASIGDPYLDVKADLDNFAESLSHAVGEEVALVAAGEDYTPTAASNWTTSPTTTAEAIDRLAAAVVALQGGSPIP